MLEVERTVELLAADPDLAADLAAEEERRARARVMVPVLGLQMGDEAALATHISQPGLIGFLVLEGLLLREIEIAGTVAAELIGAGDLIHPGHVQARDLSPLNAGLTWTVLERTELALLDGRFTARAGSWPQIFGRIALRAVWRTHGLALNLAISHQARIEDRLLLLFWHLAQRWEGLLGRRSTRAAAHASDPRQARQRTATVGDQCAWAAEGAWPAVAGQGSLVVASASSSGRT